MLTFHNISQHFREADASLRGRATTQRILLELTFSRLTDWGERRVEITNIY
jgi:hypothetical protein